MLIINVQFESETPAPPAVEEIRHYEDKSVLPFQSAFQQPVDGKNNWKKYQEFYGVE